MILGNRGYTQFKKRVYFQKNGRRFSLKKEKYTPWVKAESA